MDRPLTEQIRAALSLAFGPVHRLEVRLHAPSGHRLEMSALCVYDAHGTLLHPLPEWLAEEVPPGRPADPATSEDELHRLTTHLFVLHGHAPAEQINRLLEGGSGFHPLGCWVDLPLQF